MISDVVALSRDKEKDNFSKHALYKHLVKFIVVNNEVCLVTPSVSTSQERSKNLKAF